MDPHNFKQMEKRDASSGLQSGASSARPALPGSSSLQRPIPINHFWTKKNSVNLKVEALRIELKPNPQNSSTFRKHTPTQAAPSRFWKITAPVKPPPDDVDFLREKIGCCQIERLELLSRKVELERVISSIRGALREVTATLAKPPERVDDIQNPESSPKKAKPVCKKKNRKSWSKKRDQEASNTATVEAQDSAKSWLKKKIRSGSASLRSRFSMAEGLGVSRILPNN